jgi:hypothetical protein
MSDPRSLALAAGVAIELADLGDWGTATLVAEYDPAGPVIRINSRAVPTGSSCAVREHIDRAILHELYHHAEALGIVERLPSRPLREGAARAAAERGTACVSSPASMEASPIPRPSSSLTTD